MHYSDDEIELLEALEIMTRKMAHRRTTVGHTSQNIAFDDEYEEELFDMHLYHNAFTSDALESALKGNSSFYAVAGKKTVDDTVDGKTIDHMMDLLWDVVWGRKSTDVFDQEPEKHRFFWIEITTRVEQNGIPTVFCVGKKSEEAAI